MNYLVNQYIDIEKYFQHSQIISMCIILHHLFSGKKETNTIKINE